MLVVVGMSGVLLGWFGSQLRTVQQRASARAAIEAGGGRFVACVFWVDKYRKGDCEYEVPWLRKWMGDTLASEIAFPRQPSREDLANADAFPEAAILVMPTATQ